MKIRIDYTVEVDAAVIKDLIADYGTDETVHQFVRSYLGATYTLLDENIEAALGVSHTTEITKSNFGDET